MPPKEIHSDNLITSILKSIDNFFIENTGYNSTIEKNIDNLISVLLTIVGTYLLCWIIYRGYKILWGKSNDNFKDFLWDAFLKFIFIYICMFPNEWISLIKEAIRGFREYALIDNNYMSVPNQLQHYYNITRAITINFIGHSSNFEFLAALLYSIVAWIGFFIGAFGLFFALITNTVSFYILLFIAPIAFYGLIFGSFLKNIFTQWVTMILSNIITLFFIHIFCGYALKLINSYTTTALNQIGVKDIPHYNVAIVCIFAGICLKVFVDLVLSLAEKMTNVSLESASRGAIKGGMATLGANLGFGALATKRATKGLLFGAKGSARAYDGIKTGGKFILDKIRKTGGR